MLARQELKQILPSRSAHLLRVNHIRGSGIGVYQLACQLDLEGIVAKRAGSLYEDNPNCRDWVKIKNPGYSQKEGRGDLFKRPDKFLQGDCRVYVSPRPSPHPPRMHAEIVFVATCPFAAISTHGLISEELGSIEVFTTC